MTYMDDEFEKLSFNEEEFEDDEAEETEEMM